jgi:hypothetical protein
MRAPCGKKVSYFRKLFTPKCRKCGENDPAYSGRKFILKSQKEILAEAKGVCL